MTNTILTGKPAAPMLSVYVGDRCARHLLVRGRRGVEAYDQDDKSLGTFPDAKAAADAIGAPFRGGS